MTAAEGGLSDYCLGWVDGASRRRPDLVVVDDTTERYSAADCIRAFDLGRQVERAYTEGVDPEVVDLVARLSERLFGASAGESPAPPPSRRPRRRRHLRVVDDAS